MFVKLQFYTLRVRRMFAIGLLAAFCVAGQAVHPKRTFTHDRDLETSSLWQSFPRWEGNSLLGYSNNHSNGPILFTIDGKGRREETLFTFKDAAQINIIDAAVSVTGEIAIVGSALGGDRATTFVARIAADRQSQIITRVWPYCAMVVTFASDGSLWAIGHLKDDEDTRVLTYHVLRRFDSSGKLLGSTNLNVNGNTTDETSYLRGSRDRVGWFNRANEYIEFSLDGSEMARYEGPVGATQREISGVALSEDNEVIAGWFGKGKAELTMLDRATRTWVPAVLSKTSEWARVIGFDNSGRLVITSNNGRLLIFNRE